MESTACNLCGTHDLEWAREYQEHANCQVSFRIVKCKRCQLVYLNPRPTEEALLARSPA